MQRNPANSCTDGIIVETVKRMIIRPIKFLGYLITEYGDNDPMTAKDIKYYALIVGDDDDVSLSIGDCCDRR